MILESFSASEGGRHKLSVLQRVSGDQLGEFFGGSVASVDLDGDGLSDLVVGSPLATYEEVSRKRSASAGKYLKVWTQFR